MAAGTLSAATFTWDGGGSNNNFNTGANWDTNTVPTANSDIIFAGTTRLNVSDVWNLALNSITFAEGAGAFVISGGGHAIGAGGIVNNSSSTQTINSQLSLSGSESTWDAANGALVFGTSYFGASGKNLTIKGAHSVTMNGQMGIGKLTLSGSGNRVFNSSIQATTIEIKESASVVFNGGINTGSNGLTINTTGSVVFNSTIHSGPLTLENGHVTISGSGDSSLPSAIVNGGTLVLDQSGGRALIHSVVVNDGGTLIFADNNQIPSGGTTVTLNEGSSLYLGNTSQTIQDLIINGDTVIDFGASGSQLNIKGEISFADDITIKILNWNEEMGDVFGGTYPEAYENAPLVHIQYADSNGNVYATGTWGGGFITPGGAPIPEPATTGLMIIGGGIAFVVLRRPRR